jgi:serine/threonine-protein kinase
LVRTIVGNAVLAAAVPLVVDVSDDTGRRAWAVIVMELVEGTSLRVAMRDRSNASFAERVSWMRQAADALSAAHARGLVHRDI